jgi:hypothetical protein
MLLLDRILQHKYRAKN